MVLPILFAFFIGGVTGAYVTTDYPVIAETLKKDADSKAYFTNTKK